MKSELPPDFIIKISVIERVFGKKLTRERLEEENRKGFDRAPDSWLNSDVKPHRKSVEQYLKRVGMEFHNIHQPKENFVEIVSTKYSFLSQNEITPEEVINIYDDLEEKKYNENPIYKLFKNSLDCLPEKELESFFNKLKGYYHSYAYWQKESEQTENVLCLLIKIDKFCNEHKVIQCLMASKKADNWNYKGYIINSRHKLLWLFECIDLKEEFYPEIITIYTPNAFLSFKHNILKGIMSGLSWREGEAIPCSSRILFKKINKEDALQMKIGYLNSEEISEENQGIKIFDYIDNTIKNKQDVLTTHSIKKHGALFSPRQQTP